MPKHSKPSKARSNLAKNIRYARTTKSWSQEELAHKASLNRNFIGMVERQECAINVDTLSDLSRAFGLEPWVLSRRRPHIHRFSMRSMVPDMPTS